MEKITLNWAKVTFFCWWERSPSISACSVWTLFASSRRLFS